MESEEEKKLQHTGSVLKAYTKASFRYPILLTIIFVAVIATEVLGVIAPLYLRDFIDIIANDTRSESITHSL